jgi:hypothetical protein
MTIRTLTRLAATAALASSLALPGAAFAAAPAPAAPPTDVQAWQAHLASMRAMGPNLGEHVTDCIATHGSMAGMFGPNGMMVQGMSSMMSGTAES